VLAAPLQPNGALLNMALTGTYSILGTTDPRDLSCSAHLHSNRQNRGILNGKRNFHVRAVKQAEKTEQGQPVETRGPRPLLEAVAEGSWHLRPGDNTPAWQGCGGSDIT